MFNVTRPSAVPDCLNSGRYNDKEVVDNLIPMFFGKCYICEQDELSDPEIEHFDPHQGDETKKYDWDNLFLACSRCNSIKSTTHKNLLNCCDNSIDMFRSIKCLMPSTVDGDVLVESLIPSNPVQAQNTVKLLDLCYNSKSTPLRGVTRSVLIDKLFDHYTEFLKYRMTIKSKRSSAEEVSHAKGRLTAMLQVKYPFSVFWRWHLLSDTPLLNEMKASVNF